MKKSVRIVSVLLALILAFSSFSFAADSTQSLAKTALNETIASMASNYKKNLPCFRR